MTLEYPFAGVECKAKDNKCKVRWATPDDTSSIQISIPFDQTARSLGITTGRFEQNVENRLEDMFRNSKLVKK